ncbi:MAG: PD40 domain-containing protein [Candidatus Marinimicrobia bacterium]|nr:PD40 domain-containing protein [Candidatus Neomarinimicrobiota bacterium]MBL7011162.1 PD40 domain-containing protein [Candidatus Neomarinimicrobiota bacterium]MBL7031314.1 PD40 domain-containing protein [Candidatus Neomarinimicrobiota bacterium]
MTRIRLNKYFILSLLIYLISCDGPGGKTNFDNAPKIVFESYRSGKSEIYIIDTDGSNEFKLTDDDLKYFNPQFSPDGSKIIYESEGSQYDIFIMEVDGSGQTNLTNRHGWDHSAQFSPSGSQIVYASYRDGNSEIYLMDTDGQNILHLTPGPLTGYNPRFSPDGLKIIFEHEIVSDRSVRNIATVDISGSKPVLLTDHDTDSTLPQYSPDGSKVLYKLGVLGVVGRYDLYVMDSDGNNHLKLPIQSTMGVVFHPQFSPDGTKIAYVTSYWRDPIINMINTDGTGETILTIDPPTGEFPQFSSDGTQIVFASENERWGSSHRKLKTNIYIMFLDGLTTTQLTTEGGFAPKFRSQF